MADAKPLPEDVRKAVERLNRALALGRGPVRAIGIGHTKRELEAVCAEHGMTIAQAVAMAARERTGALH